jgi:metalloprotein, YbeY/UPF0054 family
MIKIYVSKQSNYPVSSPKIKDAVKKLLEKEGIVSDADVSVSVVGEKKMIGLAKKYLHEINVVHNVLSFPFTESNTEFIEPPDNIIHLGEIVLCYPKIVEESKKESKLIDDKVIELAEHGTMHLLGKHHE